MKEYYLKKLLHSKEELQKKIEEYEKSEIISKISPNLHEIQGHIKKAEHNLKF